MDLALKKRIDDGEMFEYGKNKNIQLFRHGKKYKLELNGILKKANYSFNVIIKELQLLKSVHN